MTQPSAAGRRDPRPQFRPVLIGANGTSYVLASPTTATTSSVVRGYTTSGTFRLNVPTFAT
jgi:hypothetical protein